MERIIVSIAGTFVTHETVFRATVFMDRVSGLIVDIGRHSIGADITIPDHCFIYVGFINAHVHYRECPPKQGWSCSPEYPDPIQTAKYKETYANAALCAIAGGITLAGDMPNKPVPPVCEVTYFRQVECSRKSQVPVMVYAGIGPETNPIEGRNVPYKAYTESVGDLNFKTDGDFFAALRRYKGKHRSLHCEAIRILHESKNAATHEDRRPAKAESVCIEDILDYVEREEPAARLKFCHCSVCKGIDLIIAAKKRGRDVLCEVTIQHLFFDTEMLGAMTPERRKLYQMNPPMRSQEERLGLIEHLRSGAIDMLITDYAPHTPEEKQKGMSGMAPDDSYGSFTTWLGSEHGFSPKDIARICSYNPGKFVNEFLDPEEFGKGVGVLDIGYTASFTVIDPTLPHKVRKADLKTKAGQSPFENAVFPGSVTHTIIRGVIYPR